MKKYLLLLLLGTFLCACSSDDGEGIPFVTDVVMPSEARTFAPGDEVTVSAKGFEAGDDIMLRIAWPLTNAAISEGYADGVWGVVTSRTESSITFLRRLSCGYGRGEAFPPRQSHAARQDLRFRRHAACVVYALRGSQ